MPGTMAQVIESAYLETVEGLFFAVKGMVHPPDRTIAILRYVPEAGGERHKDVRAYHRVYHFAEQEEILRMSYPQYLYYEPLYQVILQGVPHACIKRIYDPSQRLFEIAAQDRRDDLEADAYAFAALLQEQSGVPWTSLGVSGSLLIGLQVASSDLDLTIIGDQACRAVYHSLKRCLETGMSPELRRFDHQELEQLYQERVADTWMSFEDFVLSEKNKVFQGKFKERTYFIRFIKAPDEVGERYGDYRYTPLGQAGLTARVTSAEEAIFTPCRYPLAEVKLFEGIQVETVEEIVSYRGRFCEQANAGDQIVAIGTVERVQAREGQTWQRLLLGNHRQDTMLVRGGL